MALFRLSILVLFLLTFQTEARAISIRWDAPATNQNGTPLTDLAGYYVQWGTAPGQYPNRVDVGNVQSFTVPDLSDGVQYHVVVSAYDHLRNESSPSNVLTFKVGSEGGSQEEEENEEEPGENCEESDCEEEISSPVMLDFLGLGYSQLASYQKIGKKGHRFELFDPIQGRISSMELKTKKRGYMVAPGNYDGSNQTMFGVVSHDKKGFHWTFKKITSESREEGDETTIRFGKVSEQPIAGCNRAQGRATDLATLSPQGVFKTIDPVTREKSKQRSRFLKNAKMASCEGDLILVYREGKGRKLRNRSRARKKFSISQVGREGPIADPVNIRGVVFMTRADLNQDGIDELVVATRSRGGVQQLLFYLNGSSDPVPVEIPEFKSITKAQLRSSEGDLVDGVLAETKEGTFYQLNFKDLEVEHIDSPLRGDLTRASGAR